MRFAIIFEMIMLLETILFVCKMAKNHIVSMFVFFFNMKRTNLKNILKGQFLCGFWSYLWCFFTETCVFSSM